MEIARINIGLSIEQRLNELGMSKSELGRKIGIPQQNINRILDKSSIDTDKLAAISKALDFNFFDCFRPIETNETKGTAMDGSVAVSDNATAHHISTNVVSGGDAIQAERIKSLETLLKEKDIRLAEKDTLLAEKERIIKVYERINDK